MGHSPWALDQWRLHGSFFGDPVVATALLDRLRHHSIVVQIEGASYRLCPKADLIPEHTRAHAATQTPAAHAPSSQGSARFDRPEPGRRSRLPGRFGALDRLRTANADGPSQERLGPVFRNCPAAHRARVLFPAGLPSPAHFCASRATGRMHQADAISPVGRPASRRPPPRRHPLESRLPG